MLRTYVPRFIERIMIQMGRDTIYIYSLLCAVDGRSWHPGEDRYIHKKDAAILIALAEIIPAYD